MDRSDALADLVARAVQAARDAGLEARAIGSNGPAVPGPGVWVEFTRGTTRLRLPVEVRRRVTPDTLGPIAHYLGRHEGPVLLISELISPSVAEQLRDFGVQFLDTAGNAHLDQGPFLVWISGRKRAVEGPDRAIGRAFQPAGVKVLFVLLSRPTSASLPYRTLGAMAGVAHGAVGWVMTDLVRLGYLHEFGRGRRKRRLLERARLLPHWVEAYARVLRPRTMIGLYFAPTIQGWREWHLATPPAHWGGEPAAALLTGYLDPGALTIYAPGLLPKLAMEQKLLPVARSTHTVPVEFRRQFWNLGDETLSTATVPPLLVYADLLATGDQRCHAAAELVYEKHVAGLVAEE